MSKFHIDILPKCDLNFYIQYTTFQKNDSQEVNAASEFVVLEDDDVKEFEETPSEFIEEDLLGDDSSKVKSENIKTTDEEVESERFANEIYVKKELYNDMNLTNFDNFIKKNKIEQIYIEKEENIIILENTYLDNFLNSCKKISRNWKEYLESFENEEDIEFDKFISVNSIFYLSNGIEYSVPLTYFVDDDVFWYELDADEENFEQEMYEMKLNTIKQEIILLLFYYFIDKCFRIMILYMCQ